MPREDPPPTWLGALWGGVGVAVGFVLFALVASALLAMFK